MTENDPFSWARGSTSRGSGLVLDDRVEGRQGEPGECPPRPARLALSVLAGLVSSPRTAAARNSVGCQLDPCRCQTRTAARDSSPAPGRPLVGLSRTGPWDSHRRCIHACTPGWNHRTHLRPALCTVWMACHGVEPGSASRCEARDGGIGSAVAPPSGQGWSPPWDISMGRAGMHAGSGGQGGHEHMHAHAHTHTHTTPMTTG